MNPGFVDPHQFVGMFPPGRQEITQRGLEWSVDTGSGGVSPSETEFAEMVEKRNPFLRGRGFLYNGL
jgi:hypothetical protein